MSPTTRPGSRPRGPSGNPADAVTRPARTWAAARCSSGGGPRRCGGPRTDERRHLPRVVARSDVGVHAHPLAGQQLQPAVGGGEHHHRRPHGLLPSPPHHRGDGRLDQDPGSGDSPAPAIRCTSPTSRSTTAPEPRRADSGDRSSPASRAASGSRTTASPAAASPTTPRTPTAAGGVVTGRRERDAP